jgi:biotin synthase
MSKIRELIDKLEQNKVLTHEEFISLLEWDNHEDEAYLYEKARDVRHRVYGKDIYVRGLIEFTNYCKNDCYYCGIRKSNACVQRYRLSNEQIMECCHTGYELGFRTFVLQGGEDGYFTDEKMTQIIRLIKQAYPDCAVTLSVGERSYESYKKFFDAGADRYLLRHETANFEHYASLHPKSMSLSERIGCLFHLKEIGYQVGCGFMIGSPFQTNEHIINDLYFMKELNPHMVGIGPFIPHNETSFSNKQAGTLEKTLRILAIIRLMLPSVLLPSTTALGTIHTCGRQEGILAGANVVMPNLSPLDVRKKYMLYNDKICTGDEAAEGYYSLKKQMEDIGYNLAVSRGDYKYI